MSGTGVEPSLAVDPPELYLPMIPVGETATSIFHVYLYILTIKVINYGCERVELVYKIPDFISRYGYIEIMFPEGNLLKADGERLTLVVKFVSRVSLPVSFLLKIEISDPNGHLIYLPVHGTVDSSFLSSQSFIWSNAPTFELSADKVIAVTPNQTFKIETTELRSKVLAKLQPARTPLGVLIDRDLKATEHFYTALGGTLLRWLEEHMNLQVTTIDFPAQLIMTDGKAIFDLLTSLSGKKITGLASPSALAALPEDRVRYIHRQYIDLINHLELLGGMMSSVKAECLLSEDELKIYLCQKLESLVCTEYVNWVRVLRIIFTRKLSAISKNQKKTLAC
jgi:hypothetical protein